MSESKHTSPAISILHMEQRGPTSTMLDIIIGGRAQELLVNITPDAVKAMVGIDTEMEVPNE